jgi:hypothetical protein
MPLLPQTLVHLIEAGPVGRVARILLVVLAALLLALGYNLRAYRNFAAPEAMDQAQLARNLAEGKGFTTLYIRPFSMFLLRRANLERFASLTPDQRKDTCEVWGPHPDISNPPGYPVVLAALMKMKLVPETADATKNQPFWWSNGTFARYAPDFFITMFNQVLLLVVAFMTFFLARRLFDNKVAWLSAILVFCTEQLWRFSVSGLSTMLLLVIFMAFACLLVAFNAEAGVPAGPEPGIAPPATNRGAWLLWFAAAIGLLLGLGMLTRYSFGVLLLPALGYVVNYGGRWRAPAVLIIMGVFLATVAPWLVRNSHVCGLPFGTAQYTLLENSVFFPAHRLDRSLEPNFTYVTLTPLWWKFFVGLRKIVTTELLQFGNTWISAFFLAGLMVPFRNPAIARLRRLILLLLVTLVVAQALGRTAVSDDSPELNSENLLILLLPVVMIYGVSFFFTLLEQDHMPLGFPFARIIITTLFGLIVALPMVFVFLPPRTSSVAPPYSPPAIQSVCAWMREGELVMSDMPWAVAWYGNRQSILPTLEVLEDQSDFYAINDYIKPIKAMYLTPLSLDARFLSDWARGGTERSWGNLILAALNKEVLPLRFPLGKSVRMTDQLFLSDWERWLKPERAPAKP